MSIHHKFDRIAIGIRRVHSNGVVEVGHGGQSAAVANTLMCHYRIHWVLLRLCVCVQWMKHTVVVEMLREPHKFVFRTKNRNRTQSISSHSAHEYALQWNLEMYAFVGKEKKNWYNSWNARDGLDCMTPMPGKSSAYFLVLISMFSLPFLALQFLRVLVSYSFTLFIQSFFRCASQAIHLPRLWYLTELIRALDSPKLDFFLSSFEISISISRITAIPPATKWAFVKWSQKLR